MAKFKSGEPVIYKGKEYAVIVDIGPGFYYLCEKEDWKDRFYKKTSKDLVRKVIKESELKRIPSNSSNFIKDL